MKEQCFSHHSDQGQQQLKTREALISVENWIFERIQNKAEKKQRYVAAHKLKASCEIKGGNET